MFNELVYGMGELDQMKSLIGYHYLMHQWISINDQLPEPDVNVLVYDDGEGRCVAYYNQTGWWSYPMQEGTYNSLLDVTHWMELPEPPK